MKRQMSRRPPGAPVPKTVRPPKKAFHLNTLPKEPGI
jgi:hypothetical protein